MTVDKNGLYDVYFSRTDVNTADVLIMYGVDIHAGEDVEQVCNDWLVDDVKDPSLWGVTRIESQKKEGK